MTSYNDPYLNTSTAGWSPVIALQSKVINEGESNEKVLYAIKLVNWSGGTGTKPTTGINKFVGESGYVDTIEEAKNIVALTDLQIQQLLAGLNISGSLATGSINTRLLAALAVTAEKLGSGSVIDIKVSYDIDPRKLNNANNDSPTANTVATFKRVINGKGEIDWKLIDASNLKAATAKANNTVYGADASGDETWLNVTAKHLAKDSDSFATNEVPIVNATSGQFKLDKIDSDNVKDDAIQPKHLDTTNTGSNTQLLSKNGDQFTYVDRGLSDVDAGDFSTDTRRMVELNTLSAPDMKVDTYSYNYFYHQTVPPDSRDTWMRDVPNGLGGTLTFKGSNNANIIKKVKKGSHLKRYKGAIGETIYKIYQISGDAADLGGGITSVNYGWSIKSGDPNADFHAALGNKVEIYNFEIHNDAIASDANIAFSKLKIDGHSQPENSLFGGDTPEFRLDYLNNITKFNIPNYEIYDYGNYQLVNNDVDINNGKVRLDLTNKKIKFKNNTSHRMHQFVKPNVIFRIYKDAKNHYSFKISTNAVLDDGVYTCSYSDIQVVGSISNSSTFVVHVIALHALALSNLHYVGTPKEGAFLKVDSNLNTIILGDADTGSNIDDIDDVADTANRKALWSWDYIKTQTNAIPVNTLVWYSGRLYMVTAAIADTNTTVRNSNPREQRSFFDPIHIPDLSYTQASSGVRFYEFGDDDSGNHHEAIVAVMLDAENNRTTSALVMSKDNFLAHYTPSNSNTAIDFNDSATYNVENIISLEGSSLVPSSYNLHIPHLQKVELSGYTKQNAVGGAGQLAYNSSTRTVTVRAVSGDADKLDYIIKAGYELRIEKDATNYIEGVFTSNSKSGNINTGVFQSNGLTTTGTINNTDAVKLIAVQAVRTKNEQLTGNDLPDDVIDSRHLNSEIIGINHLDDPIAFNLDIPQANPTYTVSGYNYHSRFGGVAARFLRQSSSNVVITKKNTDASWNQIQLLGANHSVRYQVDANNYVEIDNITGIGRVADGNNASLNIYGTVTNVGTVPDGHNTGSLIITSKLLRTTDTGRIEKTHIKDDAIDVSKMDIEGTPATGKFVKFNSDASKLLVTDDPTFTLSNNSVQHAHIVDDIPISKLDIDGTASTGNIIKKTADGWEYSDETAVTFATKTEVDLGTNTTKAINSAIINPYLEQYKNFQRDLWDAWSSAITTTNTSIAGLTNVEAIASNLSATDNVTTVTMTANQIRGVPANAQGLPTRPSDPFLFGALFYDGTNRYLMASFTTTANVVYKYVNSAWVEMGSGHADWLADVIDVRTDNKWKLINTDTTDTPSANNYFIRNNGSKIEAFYIVRSGSNFNVVYRFKNIKNRNVQITTTKFTSSWVWNDGDNDSSDGDLTQTSWNYHNSNLDSLPLQVGDASDYLEWSGTGVIYFGSGNMSPIGIECKLQYAVSNNKDGGYSAWTDIKPVFYTSSNGALVFRSKIVSGGDGSGGSGDDHRDYSPRMARTPTIAQIATSGTPIVAGQWVKIRPLFRLPSSDFTIIREMYAWSARVQIIKNKQGL